MIQIGISSFINYKCKGKTSKTMTRQHKAPAKYNSNPRTDSNRYKRIAILVTPVRIPPATRDRDLTLQNLEASQVLEIEMITTRA